MTPLTRFGPGGGFAILRDMAQRSVELLIGRLVTDEGFRAMFVRNPAATLTQFAEWGYELTSLEIAALVATDHGLWNRTAQQVDPRLQKASWLGEEL